MNFTSIAAIEIRERQRETVRDIVSQLKESIASKGLLHPIVVARDNDGTFLVAGRHRLAAVKELHEEKRPFVFNGTIMPGGMIATTNVLDLSPADLMETELEENIIRAEVSWQDKARALSAIHELRQKENPHQTYSDTAREIDEKRGKPLSRQTRLNVRNATILAKNLHRPAVAKARNSTEALGLLLKEETARVEAEMIRRRTAAVSGSPDKSSPEPRIKVIHGDLQEVMPTLDADFVDLIIADLPYGIRADTFRNRTAEHHNYDDTQKSAQTLMQAVIAEGFRVCKGRANLFIFGDVDLFGFFKTASASMGWKPFRTPIIWRKSESEGLAPWGREGFRRTYELIFFATKGQRGLLQSPIDILDEKRVGRAVRRYGPEKPVGLITQLIECSTMPGDFVLDPCCGAGSTLAAARHLNRPALGIELDEGAYNLAVVAADHDEGEGP